MNLVPPGLTPAQESLFLTLGSRALDSRLPDPFLGDTLSDETVARTGYQLDRFPQLATAALDQRSKVFDVAVRTKLMDQMVRDFVQREPRAVVLDLGAGLDCRCARVDPPPSVDGLMLFLTQDDLVSILRRLTTHFPSGEVILNAYTSYAMWTFKRSRAMAPIAGDIASPGLNNPRKLEKLVDGLHLVDEILLTRTSQVAGLPRGPRWAFRVAARSALLSRLMTTVVLRYRF